MFFMNGPNYRAAVNCHKNGEDTDVIHKHFRAYQEKGCFLCQDGGMLWEYLKRQGNCAKIRDYLFDACLPFIKKGITEEL